MSTICGAKCDNCQMKAKCMGCEATCGKPFGGTCIAAEYIKAGGKEQYHEFKKLLLGEVNELLKANGIPEVTELCELAGSFINLAYPLPSGEKVKMLDDTKVYLGAQIEMEVGRFCYGVAADTGFILICSYSAYGSEPELIAYKKR